MIYHELDNVASYVKNQLKLTGESMHELSVSFGNATNGNQGFEFDSWAQAKTTE